MQPKNNDAPKDLVALLEDNFKSGRPLLQDAILYRGTRRPDQTSSSYSGDTMHGSLLPQVAASYTHNWKESTSFVGTYKVDRESTRFYRDFGLEQHLDNKPAPSVSVREAEKFLEPFVRNLAAARTSQERGLAEEKLETAIKRNLYESNVPTRTASGEPNRPVDLYLYNGRPDVGVRQAVAIQLTKVGLHNEAAVKAFMVKNHRNPAIKAIHQLSTHPGPAQKALEVLGSITQREFSSQLQVQHGHKAFNHMLNDIAKQPLSADQERMGRFAKALVESVGHPNPSIQAKAKALAFELTQLDKSTATFKDVAKVSAVISAVYGKPEAGTSKGVDTPSSTKAQADPVSAPRSASTMDR